MDEASKTVTSQSAECPVCLSTFTDPKILSCSHTFCKICLENLLECHGNSQIRCPVCRAVTQVPHQDVGKLQVNLALKSLIDDMKGHPQICTNCKSNDKPHADVYCQECCKYLCTSCLTAHSQWQGFKGHEVIAMSEISSGRVSVRRYRKCRNHPKKDEDYFCSTCRRFTCFECGRIKHKDEGHQVVEGAVYEDKHMKKIEDLKSKVDKKRSCFQKYIDFIDDQWKSADNAKKRCTKDIKKTYDEAVRQLTNKRESLQREVKETTEGVEKELESMKTTAQKRINQLTTIADMVTKRTKIPLDMDTLAAHDTLCEELREVLDQDDPDYEQPRKSSKKGRSVFKRNIGKNELGLGKIVNVVGKAELGICKIVHVMIIIIVSFCIAQITLQHNIVVGLGKFVNVGLVEKNVVLPTYNIANVKNVALPAKNSMNAMVSTPDGRMAVGYHTGGISIFSADGKLQQTVLKDVNIFGVGFLSDGRCVVIDTSNNIRLYTPEYTKLNVMFKTLSRDEGGFSKLTVDDDDLIYVSYRKAKKILVFSTAGGQAIREIPCNGYVPQQITSYHGSLITKSDDTIRLIDKEGAIQHELKKPGSLLYAAVSQWNTILIAKVKHGEGLVSIDEYTYELRHIRNLVNDYKIEKPDRNWYYLQQYRSGEIAFCTPDRLYIFR
ncbi:tripartite motif-containing protein 59-like [Lytechinus variegatus]|uniref:tripartite motif-containing protein 59-like n=1 Tax=Lytechinus variegatus TaxID=7654 RepID=UPI001BB1E01B|nr:tripartite motif-containing protein 59-like [Lytechinus variegatus]